VAAAGLLVAGVGVVLPGLVWLSGEAVRWFARAGGPTTPAGGAVSTVLLAYLGTLTGVLWRQRVFLSSGIGRIRGWLTGTGGGGRQAVPRGLLQRLVVWAAFLGIAAALLILLGWVTGTSRSWPWWVPVGTYGLFGFAVLFLDQTWLSLHPFYRRRLATAFAVRRATSAGGRVVAAPYDFDAERTTLSRYARRPDGGRFPKVIFAAAANLSGPDRTPPGRSAVSFTLADDWVGGPDVGWMATGALQAAVSGHLERDLTVQAAVAISGAAFASAMGRQSRSYQAFFALSNARLGAWLPNPRFVCARAGREPPHWTVPPLPRLRRLSYLLREIVGSHPLDDRLLYCTDGGHYENLGLVELLRHRCRLVYCIDASGDAPPLAGTLGQAITLAREELGVQITLHRPLDLVAGSAPVPDPTGPLAALGDRLASTGVLTGEITYPEPVTFSAEAPPTRTGILVVAKATLDRDLPYDLLSYAVSNQVFPHDSTSDQWFDHGQFDAYQALGRHLGALAAAAGRLGGADPAGRGASRSYR